MSHERHFPILQSLGLSEAEAALYELLLELGASKAGDLAKKSGIGRGNVYNVLSQLQARGLVLPIEGKKLSFQAVDPSRLRGLLDARLEEASRLSSDFEKALPLLASHFSLSTGRPAIQIFEGLEGAKAALFDSLQSKTEILTYFDVAALKGPMAEINKGYVRQRVAKKIAKRLVVADTPEARKFFAAQRSPYTKVAFVKGYLARHATAMELYDGTVSYLTLEGDKRISVLIKDAHIYEMHRQQFEYVWGCAAEVVAYGEGGASAGEGTASKAA